MKHIASLTALFWSGASFTGLIIGALDVYWIGHPSPHSKPALFQVQAIATLAAATIGAVLYFIGLITRRAKFVSGPNRSMFMPITSGTVYSAALGLSGQGVLALGGGTTGIGWMLLFLLPIALSFMIQENGVRLR